MSVLIVEDDPILRVMYERIASQSMVHAVIVETGAEALAALYQGATFTLVVLDLTLPDMDGLDLAEAVRKRLPDARLVCISGLAALAQRNGRSRVFDAVLDKPLSFDDLRAALKTPLEAV